MGEIGQYNPLKMTKKHACFFVHYDSGRVDLLPAKTL